MQEYRNTESIETVKKRFKEITFSQFKNQAYSSADRAPDSGSGCRGFESLLAF